MIISASRRTDIPAFYCEWFMNRIRAGYCQVPNPMNMKQIATVSLLQEDVDAIVFWSKNPAPLLPHFDELDKRGYCYYLQFTLNNYPRALEPNVPPFSTRVDVFKSLSKRIGPTRVVWRYDPIIISNITNLEFHREAFTLIAEELRGTTERVMVSIVDFYRKTDRRLSQLEKEEGFEFQKDIIDEESTIYLLKDLAKIAKINGIEIYTCAEERDYSKVGIPPGRCIDDRIIKKIRGKEIRYKKDPYQRDSCLCMISKDIGLHDTCMHGCQYCYATTNYNVAQLRYRQHDPLSPVLWGKMSQEDNNQQKYGQKSLF